MNTDTREIRNFLTPEALLKAIKVDPDWRELKNCPFKVCTFFKEVNDKMYCTASEEIWERKGCFRTKKGEENG